MWDIFISNQKYSRASFYRINGDKDECLRFIVHLLIANDVTEDKEFGLDSIKVSERQIDYYGMTKDGSNLIIAAFNVMN